MRAPNIDLVEMADTAIARSDRDILELNVHIVLSCSAPYVSAWVWFCERENRPSSSLPRYTWPEVISRVTTWPCENVGVSKASSTTSLLLLNGVGCVGEYMSVPAPRSAA
jgi:hypothetical protein